MKLASHWIKSGRLIEQTTTTGGKVSYRYNTLRDLLTEMKNGDESRTRSKWNMMLLDG
ncbi:MAG: hypothetical protein R3E08_09240 [Thiotrichaceae bacterium]